MVLVGIFTVIWELKLTLGQYRQGFFGYIFITRKITKLITGLLKRAA